MLLSRDQGSHVVHNCQTSELNKRLLKFYIEGTHASQVEVSLTRVRPCFSIFKFKL